MSNFSELLPPLLTTNVGNNSPTNSNMALDSWSIVPLSNESVLSIIHTSPTILGSWSHAPDLVGPSTGVHTSTRDLRFGGLTWMSRDGAGSESTTPPHLVTILLITLGVVALVIVLVCVVLYLLKRSKLDKIRHHLMPLYNFDPADEEPHWEQDLMEDDREQQIALNDVNPTSHPKLKFQTSQDA